MILKAGYILLILLFLLRPSVRHYAENSNPGKHNKKPLIIASTNSFPPVNFLDNNKELTGFAKDISTAVSKSIGREVKYIHSPHWTEVLSWLKSGKADIIHNAAYSPRRAQSFNFSEPIITMSEVIFVRKDHLTINNFNSLKNKKVSCVEGHITHQYLKQFPDIQCVINKTPKDALYHLMSGRSQALVYPKEIMLYLAQKNQLSENLKIVGQPTRLLKWSMVTRKENQDLIKQLNKGIHNIKQSGEYDRIYNKWFGKEVLSGYSWTELISIVTLAGMFTLFGGIGTTLFITNRRLKRSEESHRALIEQASDGIFIIDQQGNFLNTNTRFRDMMGYSQKDFKQITFPQIFDPLDTESRPLRFEEILKGNTIVSEQRMIRKDGTVIETESTGKLLSDGRIEAIVRDITDRKRAEDSLNLSNRALKIISKCNQLLLTATEEERFMKDICDLLIKDGNYRMAWAGYLLQDEKQTIKPIAYAGYEEGYIEKLNISLSDKVRGRGPTGNALLSRIPVVVQNILDDPTMEPWKADAKTRNYNSVIALPLIHNEHLIGNLNIYSQDPYSFDQNEYNLLQDLANDLSYGINVIRSNNENKKLQEALKQSEDSYRTLIEQASDGIFLIDQQGNFLNTNVRFSDMLGYTKDDFIQMKVHQILDPNDIKNNPLRFHEILKGDPIISHRKMIRKDGSVMDAESTAKLLSDGRIEAIVRDVTERKRAEEILYKLNRALKILSDCNHLLINATDEIQFMKDICKLLVDTGHYKLAWVGFTKNDNGKRVIPVAQEGFEEGYLENIHITWDGSEYSKGPTGQSIITGKEQASRDILTDPNFIPWREQAIKCGYASSIALPLISSNQTLGSINLYSSKPHSFDEEEIKLLQELANDLAYGIIVIRANNEHRNMEEALRRSERSYRALTQNIPGIVYRIHLQEKKSYFMNDMFNILTGYKKEDFSTCTLEDIIQVLVLDEDKQQVKDTLEQAILEIDPYQLEFRFKDKNGNIRYFVDHGRVVPDSLGNASHIEGIIFDTTEQALLENHIRQFKTTLDKALDCIFMFRKDNLRFSYANEGAIQHIGYSMDELSQMTPFAIKPEYNESSFSQLIEPLLNGATKQLLFQTIHQHKDGRNIPVEILLQYIEIDNKNSHFIAIARDITERKAIENAIKKSETRYKELSQQFNVLLDAIPDSIILIDQDLKIKWANESAVKLFHHNILHGEKPHCYQCWIDEPKPCSQCNIQSQFQTGESHSFQYETPNGRTMQISLIPVKDECHEVRHIIEMIRDVTENKRLREEMINRERMESIGILAGGIAHDLNNILTSLSNTLAITKISANSQDKVIENVNEAEKIFVQAKNLSRQLTSFSKGDNTQTLEVVSLNNIIEDICNIATMGTNVMCQCKIENESSPVEINPGQMSQVFSNILINAVEAMPEGGQIEVNLKNLELIQDEIPPLKKGQYVKISIKDQGIGISDDNIKKIFNPYFSTKKRGSGLGLSNCYYIINSMNGTITVESQLWYGTTFHIYLPVSEKGLTIKNTESKPMSQGKGSILLMDDDEKILKKTTEILIHYGYNVDSVNEGTECIRQYEDNLKTNHPYNAVILDLMIQGGMGGKETITKLLEIDPNIKAIISSGNIHDPVMTRYSEYGFKQALEKPYSINELIEALEKVLEQ